MSHDKKPYTVFISSTFIDNEPRRKLAEDAILRAGMIAVGMERFTAIAHPVVAECERPQHDVAIRPFLLGRYPVTNEEYAHFLEANPDAKEPRYWADRRFNQDHQPVVGVDWKQAKRFCAWAGGRLPTEAEWEYACRAGTTTAFHWGDDEGQAAEFAWYGENSGGATHPEGEKRPNPWGLHDLNGNALEWTEDVYCNNYEGASADGSARDGRDWDHRKVVRGGLWENDSMILRSAYRTGYPEAYRSVLGFRLAQDLP